MSKWDNTSRVSINDEAVQQWNQVQRGQQLQNWGRKKNAWNLHSQASFLVILKLNNECNQNSDILQVSISMYYEKKFPHLKQRMPKAVVIS